MSESVPSERGKGECWSWLRERRKKKTKTKRKKKEKKLDVFVAAEIGHNSSLELQTLPGKELRSISAPLSPARPLCARCVNARCLHLSKRGQAARGSEARGWAAGGWIFLLDCSPSRWKTKEAATCALLSLSLLSHSLSL